MEWDKCGFVAYADDIVLTTSEKFIDTVRNRIQLALKNVSEWASERGIGFNPDRTEVVIFTRRYKRPKFRSLILNRTYPAFASRQVHYQLLYFSKYKKHNITMDKHSKIFGAYMVYRSRFSVDLPGK